MPRLALVALYDCPGRVAQDLASELDLFATCVELAGGRLPADRPYDSYSLVPLFRGTASARAMRFSTTMTIRSRPCARGHGSCTRRPTNGHRARTKSHIESPPLLFTTPVV